MLRAIDFHLQSWKIDPRRKPLLLQGARQVGKTFVIRKLGHTFENFVEVNFEFTPQLKKIFIQDLDPQRIIRDLAIALKTTIIPGKTLLFIDEIQAVPEAIISLRYFYENMPELHVIAAGSLIAFALDQVGFPVGRVDIMHLYPLSWLEFLLALEEHQVLNAVLNHDIQIAESDNIHVHILNLLRDYFAIGGMPEVVDCWIKTKDPLKCSKIQQSIINSYRLDFPKYAKQSQIKYVELVFEEAIYQLGEKFQFSKLNSDYRKRELSPALDLLEKACVIHRVRHSSGQGIPLGAEVDNETYKVIFLDIGLSQAMLGLDLADWFIHGMENLNNNGPIAEAFVGQELLAYANPYQMANLFFWLRKNEAKSSSAEIDYLIQHKWKVIPIEVKSGKGTKMKSMNLFLESHPKSMFGIRYSTHNYSLHEHLKSYPLYAIAQSIYWQFQDFPSLTSE